MSDTYQKYFSSHDISSAKADFMFDIKNHILYGNELTKVINEIEKHGMLENKSFLKEKKDNWTDQYATSLATGFAYGYFSKEYLEYFAEVSEYLYRKRRKIKLLITCMVTGIILLILFLIIKFGILNNGGYLNYE
jgi:H+/Cl- antiporter ClcA